MTEADYWARLKACGIVQVRQLNGEKWICRRGRGAEQVYPIIVEDPAWLTADEREVVVEEYRVRYALFDC